tara:strand:- start:913 stop:1428 length:516 start_codon:yes stop_codon:yes gene_type:complete
MAGSLILIQETTVSSAVSSVSLVGIDSTFDVYKVVYSNVFMSSSGAQNRIRFTVSGSADTSSNYDRASLQMYTNQSFFNSSGTNGDHISSLALGTTQDKSDYGILYLFNFNNSSEYSFITREQIQTNSSSEIAGIMGGAVLTVDQATDGIQFFASTGNIASGKFKLFGIVK